jgi:hypothetical protein
MAYTTSEGRQRLLDTTAQAAELLGLAVGSLLAAYEELDEATAERLEEQLFRPVQAAYGRAKRTHAEFADRHGLPEHLFPAPAPGAPGLGVKALIERAVEEARGADAELADLQDSLLPVEVGDAQLREGLVAVRMHLDHVSARARELVRTFGR